MKLGIKYLLLKDHSCLQPRHDVLQQATSCCIERKFSAGHHIAIHQLQREDRKKSYSSSDNKKAEQSSFSPSILTVFMKSSFLNRILSKCPSTHSGSALPSGQEGNVKNNTLQYSCHQVFCFCFFFHTRMSIIKRIWVRFVVLLCLLLNKL